MVYTVYILYAERSDKIYIGYTSDIILRMKSHNHFGKGWTAGFRPWVVIYSEYYESKAAALHRERQLKSAAARQRVRELINTEYKRNGYISGVEAG